ncbi:MAG TPA: DUF5752 family protein, partial [Candidatus Eisenbacteria bacterium]|nr:DUF5752 family protein [Candidatus Eisenbacteria bacterium]
MIETGAFELRSVVHLVRPAGPRARNLESLRLWIAESTAATLFYHAVQCPLRRPDSAELPPDDLSAWVHGVVQDRETAERISFAVQSRASSAHDLREGLLEVLDSVSERDRGARGAPEESEFVFLTAESVPVPTGVAAHDGEELIQGLNDADPGVWFFHMIEEPWYTPGLPPIVRWARERGENHLATILEEESRAGRGLADMRRRVLKRWRRGR